MYVYVIRYSILTCAELTSFNYIYSLRRHNCFFRYLFLLSVVIQSGWSLRGVPFAALGRVPTPKIHFLHQKCAKSFEKIMAWNIRPSETGQRKFTNGCWCQTESVNRNNGHFVVKTGIFLFKFQNFVLPVFLTKYHEGCLTFCKSLAQEYKKQVFCLA